MEDILVPLIVFSFIYLTIKTILDYKKSKRSVGSENSLGMTELRALIREAVQEATAPLVGRLEMLEEQQAEAPLPAPSKPLLELEASVMEGEEKGTGTQSRRRVP